MVRGCIKENHSLIQWLVETVLMENALSVPGLLYILILEQGHQKVC